MELLNYGDRIPEGRYRLHSHFRRAANFLGDAGLVTVVGPSIGAGPINIVVDAFDAALCPSALVVEADRFVLGKVALKKNGARSYCSFMELASNDSRMFIENLSVLRDCLSHAAPPKSLAFLLDRNAQECRSSGYERELSAKMQVGLCRMMEYRLAEGARIFRGAGFGLTPSGDDFLSGFLLGLNAAERACKEDLEDAKTIIYENSIGKNAISNAGLACSREGRLPERFKNLVFSLARSSGEDVRINACRVFDVGATSGADSATGFYVAAVLFMRAGDLEEL